MKFGSIITRFFVNNVLRNLLYKYGYFVVEKSYYCPIPDKILLKKDLNYWYKEKALLGVDLNIVGQLDLLSKLFENLDLSPFINCIQFSKKYGPGYGEIDGVVLFSMIRLFKPENIYEIGSGVSTYFGTIALQENRKGSYTCIEPFPYSSIKELPLINKIIVEKIEHVDSNIFKALVKNDILFIDSSHTVRIGGDVEKIYTEILPNLNSGVIIHIHDIAWPFPIWKSEQVTEGNRMWTEYLIVEAFLAYNKDFEILFSSSYLHNKYPKELGKYIPFYESDSRSPVSLWLRKK